MAEQQQTPPPVVKSPAVTLRYQGGPPPPHPPVTEPTPTEEYQMAEAQRQAALAQKDQALQAEAQAPAPAQGGGGGGFFKVVKMATAAAHKVSTVASNVHAMGEEKVRALSHQHNQERFEKNFPELVQAGDTLITDYSCKIMSQGVKVSGNLQITNRHLLFVSDAIKDVIPFAEIASIQRSVALETIDNGPPYIMPVPAPHVIPDCLQIFTTTQKVYQFLAFESTIGKAGAVLTSTIKGKPIDRCYNFLDHAWRAAVPVPLPGVQYAQY
uniref:GRAM domain-containing protein n=1 Tax=Neobodo designis TaxID=312471 RepID=A0A7S1LDT5_NEODS|mmetsp:Transcript_20085/g.62388  ORF Transcript_20085/g.62388 Transcript_20085/m.62388 type:complete len:269 (+) Transcript_20085:86-892(+)|eukprot:CAMPEP_0174854820 /NCGR_PEP_ID=MMETSP1114-20130205/31969_1 /TAXON_ID=312471 /ORGANISM="Neobodo designis, Strain CCAP 1951/1" /LENGTH=268 /DNA_ID=CAMNT_0016089531 /DNA_START=81 /DNA_END=887 /DNA_ORIENTATION=+